MSTAPLTAMHTHAGERRHAQASGGRRAASEQQADFIGVWGAMMIADVWPLFFTR